MCVDPSNLAFHYFDMAVDDPLRRSNTDVEAAGICKEFKLLPIMRNESLTDKSLCLISEVG